jgi:hypothetical protein
MNFQWHDRRRRTLWMYAPCLNFNIPQDHYRMTSLLQLLFTESKRRWNINDKNWLYLKHIRGKKRRGKIVSNSRHAITQSLFWFVFLYVQFGIPIRSMCKVGQIFRGEKLPTLVIHQIFNVSTCCQMTVVLRGIHKVFFFRSWCFFSKYIDDKENANSTTQRKGDNIIQFFKIRCRHMKF